MNKEINAFDVAKFIITVCNFNKKSISNLRLQIILFLIWVDFYKNTDKLLFNDPFELCSFGVRIPDVYYEYCVYAGNSINKSYEEHKLELLQYTKILIKLINQYSDLTTHQLIQKLNSNIVYVCSTLKEKIYPIDMQLIVNNSK